MDIIWLRENVLPLMFIGIFIGAWVVCYYVTHLDYENRLKRKRKKK